MQIHTTECREKNVAKNSAKLLGKKKFILIAFTY